MNVKIENVHVATVALKEENRKFRKIDYELLWRFAQLVAIEMQKNDFYIINNNTLNHLLLTDIISGELKNTNTIFQRFEYLNWPMHKYFAIAVVDFLYQQKSENIVFVMQQIQQILQEKKMVIYEGKICILLSHNDYKHIIDVFNDDFKEYTVELINKLDYKKEDDYLLFNKLGFSFMWNSLNRKAKRDILNKLVSQIEITRDKNYNIEIKNIKFTDEFISRS